jgi:coproporphyrinogen III oxidase-like Fe-S oxidoreductase
MSTQTLNDGRLQRLLGRYARLQFRKLMNFSRQTAGRDIQIAWPEPTPGQDVLLYLHVPFCEVLCPFCSFHRVRFEEQRAQNYFAVLRQEIELATERGFRFSEMYIGGGTPTVLPEELARTIRLVNRLHGVTEVSVETNPNDLSIEKLGVLRDAGVKRLSVGVQSFDDRLLGEMQRLEKYGNSEAIISHLKEVQNMFDTLNVDMMFNFPHQDAASLQHDLDQLTGNLQIDQVSFYPLMTAPSTERPMLKTVGSVEHSRELRQYEQITEHMLSHGYRRHSAWCFSRHEGLVDEYIANQGEYLGLGSGSFSYMNGSLYANTFSINHYMQMVEHGGSCVRERPLNRREQARYHLLMRLFGGRLDLAEADQLFDGQFRQLLAPELAGLRLIKAVVIKQGEITLTESGYYLWVVLMREFFSGVNRFRDQMRHYISAETAQLNSTEGINSPVVKTSPA